MVKEGHNRGSGNDTSPDPDDISSISPEFRKVLKEIVEESDVQSAVDALLEEGYEANAETVEKLLKRNKKPKK